jgi:hypothetical protein
MSSLRELSLNEQDMVSGGASYKIGTDGRAIKRVDSPLVGSSSDRGSIDWNNVLLVADAGFVAGAVRGCLVTLPLGCWEGAAVGGVTTAIGAAAGEITRQTLIEFQKGNSFGHVAEIHLDLSAFGFSNNYSFLIVDPNVNVEAYRTFRDARDSGISKVQQQTYTSQAGIAA